ncbi:hypothetical protein VTO42DRAFT_1182 [Malbranchea cinnamomea]
MLPYQFWHVRRSSITALTYRIMSMQYKHSSGRETTRNCTFSGLFRFDFYEQFHIPYHHNTLPTFIQFLLYFQTSPSLQQHHALQPDPKEEGVGKFTKKGVEYLLMYRIKPLEHADSSANDIKRATPAIESSTTPLPAGTVEVCAGYMQPLTCSVSRWHCWG